MINNEELYKFHLVRRLKVHMHIVESTHVIETTTDDPHRTARVIEDLFHGWGVIGFVSPTDEEYEDAFNPEWAEPPTDDQR